LCQFAGGEGEQVQLHKFMYVTVEKAAVNHPEVRILFFINHNGCITIRWAACLR